MFYNTFENIGSCVEITWNYFHCVILHKEKVFIDYGQGLAQFVYCWLLHIDDFILALFLFIEDGKTVIA